MEGPVLAPDQWTRREQLLGGTVVLVGVVLAFTAGLPGGLLAVTLAGVWLVAGTPYAFVVGQVGLVVFLDGGPAATPVAQAALVVLLLLGATSTFERRETAITVAVATMVTVGLLAIDGAIAGTLRSGFVLLCVIGMTIYAVHRYERLELDLIGEPE